MTSSQRMAMGEGAGINEELDIVKSLELTAKESYEEGYQKGRKEGVEKLPLREILDWYMCSDPWPVVDSYGNQTCITTWLDEICKEAGFSDWVKAYHKLSAGRRKEQG